MITLSKRYFNWMCNLVNATSRYYDLLEYLNTKEFTYTIDMDGNREEDGIDLRYRFGYENDIPDAEVAEYLDHKPCSVLEVMVALASRIENIMEDPDIGDQSPDWFWGMIRNLELDVMDNQHFDKVYIDERIDIFLNREYEPDGKGGLFRIKGKDLRGVEIWIQAMWYLDQVISERR